MGVITVGLLGSTGSIGTQTLEVVDRFCERFEIVALGAGRCSARLVDQVACWSVADGLA